MKYSLNWLKEFVDIELTPQALAEKLTLSGLEVEGLIEVGGPLSGITTGRIEKIEKHPKADRLWITHVNVGTATHVIVTAATNVTERAIVPVSIPGSVLFSGLQIREANLRGVDSYGMLCSEKEMGIKEEATGIWILPEDTPIGIDFCSFANLKDTLLEINVLPNRGDLQSIYGLAREIAAILEVPLKLPKIDIQKADAVETIMIELHATQACPLYTARRITSLKNRPSPLWMQRRLELLGIRSLGLLVDITNYVLLELGQPLHAFDRRLLKAPNIEVRYAADKEVFETLDGNKHILNSSVPVIASQGTAVALAGIMGGKNTEVKPDTTDIILESAFFNPSDIRKATQKLRLKTESAMRFEKGVDRELVAIASDRASHLYQTLGQGTVSGPLYIKEDKNQMILQPITVLFSFDKISALLGMTIDPNQGAKILTRLGFKIDKKNNAFTAVVPTWRQFDIKEMPCLAEEVIRMMGLDQIPIAWRPDTVEVAAQSALEALKQHMTAILCGHGLNQVSTFTFVSAEENLLFGGQNNPKLEITNPIAPEQAVMRCSLLPSLLKIAAYNRRRQHAHVKLFDIGKVFLSDSDQIQEEKHLSLVMTHARWDSDYLETERAANKQLLPHLKGLVEELIKQPVTYQKTTAPCFFHEQALEISVQGSDQKLITIGHLGLLHPTCLNAFDIEIPLYAISLNLTALSQLPTPVARYKPIMRFPSTRRDLALLVPKTVSFESIQTVLNAHKPTAVTEMFLFDHYESEKIGAHQRSVAVGFIYQNPDRTLSDEEVNAAHEDFCRKIKADLPITIR